MISKEEIKKLGELARLELADEEVAGLQKDISNILDYVGQVAAVSADSSTNVPLNHNVMREDVPREGSHPLSGKEEALRTAFPRKEGGYNVVRKIIQKDE